MGISKVNFGNDNLIDLTSDTVTEQTLLRGTTAHNRTGELIIGTLDQEVDGLTWNEVEGYAGYNLCPFDPKNGTDFGITLNSVSDSIQLNGTASSTHWVGISEPLTAVAPDGSLKLFAGSYKLIFTSSASLDSDCYVGVIDNNDIEICTIDTGTSGNDSFTLESDTNVLVGVKIASGKVLSNLDVQVMLVKDTVDSDVPYQKHLIRNDEFEEKIKNVVENYIYNTYRRIRKNITSLVQDGTFDKAVREQDFAKYGIAIGDYFIDSNNYTYYVGDPNHYKGASNGYTVGDNHVALVVDTKAASAYNSTSPVSGSYESYTIQQYLKNTVLPKIRTGIAGLTGDAANLHLIRHKMLVPTVNGSTLSWTWTTDTENEYITTLTENQVFGGPIWSGDKSQQGEGVKKLAIFDKFRFNEIFGSVWFWLRSLHSSTLACLADYTGSANRTTVTNPSGRFVGLILYKAKS